MKYTVMGSRYDDRILKEILETLLRIEKQLFTDKKKSEVEIKKQLLND
jgi:hypothetical protein